MKVTINFLKIISIILLLETLRNQNFGNRLSLAVEALPSVSIEQLFYGGGDETSMTSVYFRRRFV